MMKYALVICSLVQVIIFCCQASANTASHFISSVHKTTSSLGPKKLLVCTTFGFEGPTTVDLHKELFNSSESDVSHRLAGDKDILIANCREPSQFSEIGGAELTLGYIHSKTLLGNPDSTLAFIQAAIESALLRRSISTLSLLLVCSDQANVEVQKSTLLRIVEDAWKLSSQAGNPFDEHIKIQVHILSGDAFDNNNLEQTKDFIWQVIGNSCTSSNNADLFTGKSVQTNVKPSLSHLSSSPTTTNNEKMVSELIDNITYKLKQFHDPAFSPYTPTEIAAAIRLVVIEFISNHCNNDDASDEPKQQLVAASIAKMFKTSPRLQLALATQILPLYRRLLSSALTSAKDSLTASMRRVSPKSTMPRNLKALAKKTSSDFRISAEAIRNGFVDLLKAPMSNVFEAAVASVSSEKDSAGLHIDFSSRFAYGAEVAALKSYCAEATKDRVNALFLQGAYNPYIRNKPFAPLHLNLNYLFDPRAYEFGREYNPLYDEHTEGPAESRADQLRLPELSHVVFDPNDHPVPKDKRDIWKFVWDFYRGTN